MTTKLSQISTATTVALTDNFVMVQSGSTDSLVSLGTVQSELSVLTPANSNLTWYVATTGSDSAAGTSGAPFLTIQHALNVAASYNYQNLYYPTINIADGTYSQSLTLPLLQNCSGSGSILGDSSNPTNVVISDTGSTYAITTANLSNWYLIWIKISGTYGGVNMGTGAQLNVPSCTIEGTFAHEMVNNQSGPTGTFGAGANGSTLSIGGTAATGFFGRGVYFFDNSTIAILSGTNISGTFISLDSGAGSWYMDSGGFTGAANLTCGQGLGMYNFTTFEAGPTTVDGVTLTRQNFPGHSSTGGIFIDGSSFAEFETNFVIGTQAAVNMNNASAANNIVIGSLAGDAMTANTNNVLLGTQAGQNMSSGANNFCLGTFAGVGLVSGNNNFLAGYNAGAGGDFYNSTMIGFQSGTQINSGYNNNTIIGGYRPGYNLTQAANNTLIGGWAGASGSFNNVVALSDGAGNLLVDYNYTNSANWTFQGSVSVYGGANSQLNLYSGTDAYYALVAAGTSTLGMSNGDFGIINYDTGNFTLWSDTSCNVTLSGGLGFSPSNGGSYAASSPIAGISMVTTSTLAVGNGTAGNTTGTLILSTVSAGNVSTNTLTISGNAAITSGSASTITVGSGSTGVLIVGYEELVNHTVTTLSGTTKGLRAFVSDATATTFGSTVTGGGTTGVPVYYNGTHWCIG
jgi:hypothetical protein